MLKQTLFLGLATLGVMSPSSFGAVRKGCPEYVQKKATGTDSTTENNICECMDWQQKQGSKMDSSIKNDQSALLKRCQCVAATGAGSDTDKIKSANAQCKSQGK
jgi:hypothetical protein